LQRQIEDWVRQTRGPVKAPEVENHHRVTKFIAKQDWHRTNVLDDAFDAPRMGAAVCFVEEMGDKGAQAGTVRVVGIHHLL
jgi:hypothetical protein